MPTIQFDFFFFVDIQNFPVGKWFKIVWVRAKELQLRLRADVCCRSRPHWSKEDCGGKLWFSRKAFAAIIIIIINLGTIGCGALSLDSICCEQVEMYVHEFVPVSNYSNYRARSLNEEFCCMHPLVRSLARHHPTLKTQFCCRKVNERNCENQEEWGSRWSCKRRENGQMATRRKRIFTRKNLLSVIKAFRYH